MAIPDYQSLMLPLLKYASDGEEHSLKSTIDALADVFSLTESERKEPLPSGRQATFNNRVGWARTYLKKAGLLDSTRRGYFRITSRGREVLQSAPEQIDVGYLNQFDEFVEFRKRGSEGPSGELEPSCISDDVTPEEALEQAYQSLRRELAQEVLQTVRQMPANFFEHLVVDLLVKMGYGGSRKEAGQAMGKVGDGGIDGIIKEDRRYPDNENISYQ